MKKSAEDIIVSNFYNDIRHLIEEARCTVASMVNAAMTMLYWQIGKRINEEILKGKRAEYGREIVVSLIRHLSWTHFIALIPLKEPLQREFYTEMCRVERWSVRTLRKKIDSMLYERTAISKKPKELARQELAELRDDNKISPDLVFRDPYVLDFLNLKDTYSEADLGAAILRELESFILELGAGFTFVARQKRMTIDNEDFYLDVLFYHRKLKRLVAVELKLGKFKAAFKGQMELYLRWLKKYEKEKDENDPLGLILCAEGAHEQVELLEKKLHAAIEKSKELLEQRVGEKEGERIGKNK